MLHAAGWLEGGLASGYEKFIMDADQLSMFQRCRAASIIPKTARPWTPSPRSGPGSHFLGCAHTQANFENAFCRSTIADNNSFEQWRDDGSKDAATRANSHLEGQLRDYEAPDLDPGIDEALQGFMARTKEALPDGVVRWRRSRPGFVTPRYRLAQSRQGWMAASAMLARRSLDRASRRGCRRRRSPSIQQ